MTKSVLFKYLLEKFSIAHSDQWIEKLISNLKSFSYREIDTVYGFMIEDLFKIGKFIAWKHSRTCCISDNNFPDDVAFNAFDYFKNIYLKEKGNEWSYYRICAKKFAISLCIAKTKISELEIKEETYLDSELDSEFEMNNNSRHQFLGLTNTQYGPVTAKKMVFLWTLKDQLELSSNFINTYTKVQPTFSFINLLKENDFSVRHNPQTEYYINRVNALKSKRLHMEKCIEVLKKGIIEFDNLIKEPNIELKRFSQKDKLNIPMLSALAIDADGNYIASCYKGEVKEKNPQGKTRSFELHAEYSLLELVIKNQEDKERLKGGTLFVTLEPCNKRKFYCLNPKCDENCTHENSIPKIPCAVRCLESGIKYIFISNADTDYTVLNKGIFILKNGIYPIELNENYEYILYDDSEGKRFSEKKGLELLEKYFIEKYPKPNVIEKKIFLKKFPQAVLHIETEFIKLFQISTPIQVYPFDIDLSEEIILLNASFLQSKDIKSEFFLPK